MSIAMPVAPEQVEEFRADVRPADFRPSLSEAQPDHAAFTQGNPDNDFRCNLSGNGRLRIDGLSQTDRHLGVAVHLTPFIGFFFPLAVLTPLVLWLVRKDRSTFIDDHGREMVNVLISSLLVCIGGFVGGFLTLGLAWVAAVAWHIVMAISMIRAAVAANRGEYFRYPMTFRFLS